MIVKYNLIRLGKIINTQTKEYDGSAEANTARILSAQYNAMDPAVLLRDTGSADWIDACIQQE